MASGGNQKAKKATGKKSKSWASRERAGKSFTFVLAFFAVFGIIILTEVFVMDDRNRAGRMRHSGYSADRFGESVPDYEEVQADDYSDLVPRVRGQFKSSGESAPYKSGQMDAKYIQSVLSNSYANSRGVVSRFDINSMRTAGLADPLMQQPQPQRNPGQAPGQQQHSINQLPFGHQLPETLEEHLPSYRQILKGFDGGRPKDAQWQTVNGTRFKFFVYSAFYDRRNSGIVRVVGATKTRNPEGVWCRLFYPKGAKNGTEDLTVTVTGKVKVIRENWNLKYSACFVLCKLPEATKVPYAVSIVSRVRLHPKNLLLVQKTDSDPSLQPLHSNTVANGFANASMSLLSWNENKNSKEFLASIPDRMAMCIKPLHFNYDQALHLLEFLELNSILGVSHATFYNHTIGPRASCVLEKYMDGTRDQELKKATLPDAATLLPMTITIPQWRLNMESQKEIRTEGLFAALNDCLYRSMFSFSHTMFIDLDEFIIPHKNNTLTELLRWLSRPTVRQNHGAYSFQNAFFYLQFPDDALVSESTDALQRTLLTQRKTQRRKKLHPQKQRSKYIVKPEQVIEAGNHFVWEFMPGKGHMNVAADVGILHHYRVCEFGGEDCIKAASVQDRTAHKYFDELRARVGALYAAWKTKCNLPELPKVPKTAGSKVAETAKGADNDGGDRDSDTGKDLTKRRMLKGDRSENTKQNVKV